MTTSKRNGSFRLESRSFGALPVVNHFLGRIGLDELLERYLPHTDRRCRLAPSRALGLLLRNILRKDVPDRGPATCDGNGDVSGSSGALAPNGSTTTRTPTECSLC